MDLRGNIEVRFFGPSLFSTPAGFFYRLVIVESEILLELKAVKAIVPEHVAQIPNYLKATGLEVGLLLNFGKSRLEYRRFNNHYD